MSDDEYRWEVYCLVDEPGGRVRYVGVSRDASTRFRQHRRAARKGSNTAVHRWIREMWEVEVQPVCQVLERGSGIEAAGLAERKWLEHWRQVSQSRGGLHPILNHGMGGEFLNDIDEFKRRLAYVPPNKRTEAE